MIRSSYRILFLAAVLLLAAAAPPARAAVFISTKLTDSADGACDSDCSLREAVLAANAADGADFIVLGPGTYSLSLAGAGEDLGATGDLDVLEDLAIVGREPASTVIDASQLDRVLDVPAGVKLELANLTVTGGIVSGSDGGGIRSAGTLDLSRVIVSFNAVIAGGKGGGIASLGSASVLNVDRSSILINSSTHQGGGIYLDGTIQMATSSLAGNSAQQVGGGGLYASEGALGLVSSSTVFQNSTLGAFGGGVYVVSQPFIAVDYVTFQNTIIARSTTSGGTQVDCFGSALSAGHNLLGEGSGCLDFGNHPGDLEGVPDSPLDPMLAAFEETGGPTPAFLPVPGSPAIDHGADCGTVDQRGAQRPAGVCDIGAVEVVAGQCIGGGPILCLNQGRFQVRATWFTATSINSGQGTRLTDESGFFTFFDPSNVELTVKVLNGCGLGGHYWVFLSGMTNVGVTVTVTDTRSGAVKTYTNPLNKTFTTVLDTSAFPTCP